MILSGEEGFRFINEKYIEFIKVRTLQTIDNYPHNDKILATIKMKSGEFIQIKMMRYIYDEMMCEVGKNSPYHRCDEINDRIDPLKHLKISQKLSKE